jgi:hypothetical protein
MRDRKWEIGGKHSCNSLFDYCLWGLYWSYQNGSLRNLCLEQVSGWCLSFVPFCDWDCLLSFKLRTQFLLFSLVLVCYLFLSRSFRDCLSQNFREFWGLLAFLALWFLLLLLILVNRFFIQFPKQKHSDFHH